MRWRYLIVSQLAAVLVMGCLVSIASAQGPTSSRGATATRCLTVPTPLVRLLRASLAFSAGGQLFYARAVKSSAPHLYFVSAQIRSAQLGARRPLGTWAVDMLSATATASPVNAAARAYSDLATPDSGAVKVSMRSPGALASQKCVTRLIR